MNGWRPIALGPGGELPEQPDHADDDDDARRLEREGLIDDPGEHRPAAQGMEHLRSRALHALALARRAVGNLNRAKPATVQWQFLHRQHDRRE